MEREQIIRMARECGIPEYENNESQANNIIRFAALVASAERESLRESFRVVTAAEASAAILHEREACAKVCDEIYFQNYPDAEEWERSEEGEAIRKRSHV